MNIHSNIKKSFGAIALILLAIGSAFAANTPAAPASSTPAVDSLSPDTIMRYTIAGVIGLFVIIIMVLAAAIRVAGTSYLEKLGKGGKGAAKIIALIISMSLLSSGQLFAEDMKPASNANSFANWDLYLFIVILILLFMVVITLVRALFVLMGIKQKVKEYEGESAPKERTWFQRFNETVPIEDEEDLDLSHDYDGIRELDNKIPSWWTWAFLSGVAFAIIYLYRMFISETLPDQYSELTQANEIAAIQKAEYLKKGANNVDENTVTLLGAEDIGQGAALFAKNCVACHGDKGQGGVGPNLTDDYWLHKGGVKDVFYSIKYGWAEKGMKSWKEDFSPMQIAQLASFVKSLHGTNPAGAKDKQGELYSEAAASTDSTKTVAADSVSIKK